MLAVALVLPLCGCVGSTSAIDSGITTASVTPAPADDKASDEATIRNAVSSANLDMLRGNPLPWANADTGSQGEVTGIGERRGAAGQVCRHFHATVTAYDGVRLYEGEICLGDDGAWTTSAFVPAAG